MLLLQAGYYFVGAIHNRRCVIGGRNTKYFVQWAGYGVCRNTWEPIGNLENVKDMVINFNMSHGN
jgi:hypothetical protein